MRESAKDSSVRWTGRGLWMPGTKAGPTHWTNANFPPGGPYTNPDIQELPQDTELAKKLFQEAGVTQIRGLLHLRMPNSGQCLLCSSRALRKLESI